MEGPARLALAAQRAGLQMRVVRLEQGEPVPHVATTDPLVVMGGPMGVADLNNPRYPFLAAEIMLLRARLEVNAPTLGICLGAQLLAHAAGARVYPNTRAASQGTITSVIELGWAPVRFHNVSDEPCFIGMRPSEVMLHWHGDTFDLPAGSVHLASTEVCANQGFRLGTKMFGLQFHCEADTETVYQWVKEDAAYVQQALGPQGAAIVCAQTRSLPPTHWQVGDQLLDNLFACMLT